MAPLRDPSHPPSASPCLPPFPPTQIKLWIIRGMWAGPEAPRKSICGSYRTSAAPGAPHKSIGASYKTSAAPGEPGASTHEQGSHKEAPESSDSRPADSSAGSICEGGPSASSAPVPAPVPTGSGGGRKTGVKARFREMATQTASSATTTACQRRTDAFQFATMTIRKRGRS